MDKIEELAIKASIDADWKTAIKLNCEIVAQQKDNIDALNRLCFAYIQNGNKTLARRVINQILKLDRFNTIAIKNQNLVNNFSKKGKNGFSSTSNINFIEEPCVTKIIHLIDTCPKPLLLKIRPGTKLAYHARRRKICITWNNNYLGKLPDDLSRKFILAMTKKRTTYDVFFKSYDLRKASILLREQQ